MNYTPHKSTPHLTIKVDWLFGIFEAILASNQ